MSAPRFSLHGRLAAALLLVLLLTGALSIFSTLWTTRSYSQESRQRMHLDLAENIAKMKSDVLLEAYRDGSGESLAELFHWLMVVNPHLEFYLLDLEGKIVSYDGALGELAWDYVDLVPIREMLEGPKQLPLLGQNPRLAEGKDIFSVAKVEPRFGSAQGYLYVVLAHGPFDSFGDSLRNSDILHLSLWIGLAYLVIAVVAGLVLFSSLTRPLRKLAEQMRSFLESAPTAIDAKRKVTSVESAVGVLRPKALPPRQTQSEMVILKSSFEAMIRRTEHQMAEIERMAGQRNELVANISHDLRTPIALLRGYLETLSLGKLLHPEERDEYIQIAYRQSERLSQLVEELFEWTKLEEHEVEPSLERFKIAELVQDNVQRFQLQAQEKGIRLKADFDPDLPPVFADVGLMERALENLIENALRHTPEGGQVVVELREVSHRLWVRVVDNGSGIPQEDLPHIFDRFYRAQFHGGNVKGEGSGLGLAITRHIVELHGSEISVESTVGRGTTFSFYLTIAPRTHQLVSAAIA